MMSYEDILLEAKQIINHSYNCPQIIGYLISALTIHVSDLQKRLEKLENGKTEIN